MFFFFISNNSVIGKYVEERVFYFLNQEKVEHYILKERGRKKVKKKEREKKKIFLKYKQQEKFICFL